MAMRGGYVKGKEQIFQPVPINRKQDSQPHPPPFNLANSLGMFTFSDISSLLWLQ